ncbi:hypothetical protein A2716_00330 [candidate division WWE3 bacterium RIFCSPHIGHO2_01_FULL_40_23]|uniref:Uncharacterized protein n=1 Tax=candidate division WWE3 bacterium RIFCSPLOWO2_01_FULL_41_18 TaxID=1802625 RepID=A0A1F4VFF7_UNCKA|nr:MAG: hypothetical protein A2716_00330 [candidate division WWE3 bacterium RIFCSPHIGHO2_01_FULL_40_23]OGC55443.1 MAG: hypothetical protein A3A78_00600 [candidate division WWE3 bacterium RIFCSPLOWO2_01_FULL_41_18]
MNGQFENLVKSIISQQELIIGPVAIEEANKVPGLNISSDGKTATITGDGKAVLEGLVKQYASLFGRVSVEVCREAVSAVVGDQKEILPDILR